MRAALLADDIPAPLLRVLATRRDLREWDNVRAFRLIFTSGQQAVLLASITPALAAALRYSPDGDLLPSFFTVQHPRLHTVRADEILSCVEIDAPRRPRPRPRRRACRRRRRRAM